MTPVILLRVVHAPPLLIRLTTSLFRLNANIMPLRRLPPSAILLRSSATVLVWDLISLGRSMAPVILLRIICTLRRFILHIVSPLHLAANVLILRRLLCAQ